MIGYDIAQIVFYFVVLVGLSIPLGLYMASVYDGRQQWLKPLEGVLYKTLGASAVKEQHWSRYALSVLGFNFLAFIILYAILRLQDQLPYNPAGMGALAPDLAFNTAVSFITNTNWQAYSGEATMSYFSQMVGLTVQNFLSAATGMAVAVALIRAFVRVKADTIGNFWVDMVRGTLYILLPLSILTTMLLVMEGVPQNMNAYVQATTIEGASQTIAQGPAASQIAIKQIGTNGGGFFSINSAHPYENPTPLSNFIQMILILLIPASFCFMYGKMTQKMRQGIALFAAMTIMLVAALAGTYWAEKAGNPFMDTAIVQADGNMEGKEVRFGVVNSVLWATATTAASNGSVNSMHDSYTPMGGLFPMFLMMTGEVVFGGVGSGFYGMLLYVILTVFIAGLMVGRTPEYLGKKIEAREVKLCVIAMLSMPLGILGLGCLSAILPVGLASMQETGPHGFSEMLYAYTSATGNNGSAFGGYGANTPYQNTMLGICMLLGRYAFIIPMLAVAGSIAAKKQIPVSAGTFPTDSRLFVGLLIGVIIIVGGLTFFPVLALGPIAEHLAMLNGTTF
jgi:potassium-transporting ATPase potassium-binding subunit